MKKNEDARSELQSKRAVKEMDIAEKKFADQASSAWYKYVIENDSRVYSDNPVERCKMRNYLRGLGGKDFFDRNYATLNIPSDFCDNPKLLDAVVQNKVDGAEIGWTRRDPTTKILLSSQCPMRTENRHGMPNKIEHRVCALPSTVPPKARIYNVAYSCPEYACSWSYNRAGGYSADYDLSSDKRAFTTHRRWDGDPVTETYTFYYEQPTT